MLNANLTRMFTLSISAMIGIKNRASKSRSLIKALTKATSCELALPWSVKIASTRKASDSEPLGKLRIRVKSLPWFGPSERMRAVMSSWMACCTVESMCAYAAKILQRDTLESLAHAEEIARLTLPVTQGSWLRGRTAAPHAGGPELSRLEVRCVQGGKESGRPPPV